MRWAYWPLFAAIMGFALGGSFVWSLQVPNAAVRQQHAATENQRTGENAQQEGQKTEEALARYTWWLTFFTGLLAVATIGLGIATVFLYLTGEKQIAVAEKAANAATTAANAADLQAKGMIGAELPIVLVQNFIVKAAEGTPVNQTDIPEYPVLHYSIVNHGRTPAELESYCLETRITKNLPETPEYERIYPLSPGTMLLPHQGQLNFQYIFDVKGRKRAALLDESEHLWIYGYVRFTDFLGNRHETRFVAMGLLHSDKPESWFTFVYSSETPPAYAKRT
jgi:hypothetical protein